MRHQLSEADDGKVVSTRIGDVLEFRLHEMPSGGYRWMFEDPLEDLLSHPAENFTYEAGSVGGANTARFIFQVKAAGRGVLRFSYKRSWESAEPALKSCQVTIESTAERSDADA